jgi:hypothetical protein
MSMVMGGGGASPCEIPVMMNHLAAPAPKVEDRRLRRGIL